MERYFIILQGRVQGVGCRFFCQLNATKYSLTGFAENMDNGMVKLEVQGDKKNIDLFLSTIIKGNNFIKISDYSLKKIDVILNENKFNIKY